jgi:uncharacterized protein
MHAKVINESPERTYALIFETGDEVMSRLLGFARDNNLAASRMTAIGAFSRVTLGYFDWQHKTYEKIILDEQVEVLSLIGDIALKGNDRQIHAHVVVGKRDGSAHGGHLLDADVRPTLEVILVESPSYLVRTIDEQSGLALIDTGK